MKELANRHSQNNGNLSHRPSHSDGNLSHRPSHRDGNLSHRPSHRDGNLSHRPSHADIEYIEVTDAPPEEMSVVPAYFWSAGGDHTKQAFFTKREV